MELILNGEKRETNARTVQQLLDELVDCIQPTVAVMVNRRIIKRATYSATPLGEGDQVDVISIIGGG
ncbi:sulfur carrier protein ThiS [Candidatus Poribacteria bacterium]|nr:sulfur carrier protein ThiS [Candidatus Poribacteria bacterium]